METLPFKPTNHSYYMNEGSYCQSGCHNQFDSFAEFYQEWKDADKDYNRIHRFDISDPLEKEIRAQFPHNPLELKIYYLIQRKGYTISCYCKIQPEDMPMITHFLLKHWEYERKLWEEFSLPANK